MSLAISPEEVAGKHPSRELFAGSRWASGQERGVREFFQSGSAQLVASLAALAALVGVGCWLVAKFRGRTDDASGGASEMLTNFRELYERGEISEEEYRTIKARLGEHLQQELKRSDGPG